MRWRAGPVVVMAAVLGLALQPGRAWADETDNFTCRGRVTRDSLAALDGWVNARLREAIEQANRAGKKPCDEACLSRLLQDGIGGSSPKGITLIPGSRIAKWVNGQTDLDRCHLEFKETIYGARRYDQPWRFPFLHRIIFVADSIRLSGQLVGVDKVDHFIREGLAHWKFIQERGVDIAASMAHEVGTPGHGMAWTEYGVKGMSLTGVFAYADLAAGYFGYRFWQDALALGRTGSFVSRDAATGRYTQRRTFTFADYVNDAWDETINCSIFVPKLGVEVAAALAKRAMTCGTTDPAIRARLIALPDAALYVNPSNLKGEVQTRQAGIGGCAPVDSNWPGCVRVKPSPMGARSFERGSQALHHTESTESTEDTDEDRGNSGTPPKRTSVASVFPAWLWRFVRATFAETGAQPPIAACRVRTLLLQNRTD